MRCYSREESFPTNAPIPTCVPRLLLLRPFACATPLPELAAEVLALTEMNWNTTQFDQASPIRSGLHAKLDEC